MKHLLKILLVLFISSSFLISCTSSKQEDGEMMSDSEMLDEGGESLDNLDAELDGELDQTLAEDGEFSEGGDEFALDEGGDEFADEFSEESGDEFSDEFASEDDDFFAEESDEFSESGDEFAEEPLVDDTSGDAFADSSSEDSFSSDDSFADSGDDTFADTSDSGDSFSSTDAGFSEVEPVAESSGFADASGSSDDSFVETEPTKDWVPVKKMATVPFQKGGQLLNTIYIIRPNDTMQSVSQKIYGMDKSDELYSANPHLHRSFTVGDKMYYNSPNRPNDSSTIITYYEDNGIPSQNYITNEGDNIREVAYQLMGHPDSWKEMWAINMNVESKGQVPGGLELRYFPEGAAPAPTQNLAQNNTEPSMPEPEPMPADQDMGDQAMNDIPPPPPPPGEENMDSNPDLAAGTVEPPPPPPPVEPPPPPPAESNAGQQAKMDKKGGSGIFSNMKLILAAIILIGGGLAILIIQKNKSKKMNIGETQI